jgi:hypothetical protein
MLEGKPDGRRTMSEPCVPLNSPAATPLPAALPNFSIKCTKSVAVYFMAGHVVCFAMALANVRASSAQEIGGETVSLRQSVQMRDTIGDAAAGLLGGRRATR